MDTPQFRSALAALEHDVEEGARIAVMCAETLWWRCHRRLIADALTIRGFEVIHLISPGKRDAHKPHEALRAGEDGWPVYDAGTTARLL